jgi:tryptophan halogenase
MAKKYIFTIIGSGTSGWLTALYLQKYYPYCAVRVIASSDIGILGAGEGTTTNVLNLLIRLGIREEDLYKYTNATVKEAIKFTNWNGDGKSYHHIFNNQDWFNPSVYNSDTNHALPPIILDEIAHGDNLDNILIDVDLHKSNKVKKILSLNPNNKVEDPSTHFDSVGPNAIHFDASLMADFLKKTAIERGIDYVDDEVVDFSLDENEYIEYIHTKSGKEYATNFVFDCSGFRKLVIGGLYKSKWISYKEHLPMKRAIGFLMDFEDEDEIPPYTESIAMDFGWAWKIPLQTGFRCGYVYDSDYINEDDAKNEVIKTFGNDVTFGKSFEFEAGYYEKSWINNCIAIGLSAGFVEPLEATSIMVQAISLDIFLDNFIGVNPEKSYYRDRYNKTVESFNNEISEFIYTHYLSKRTSSKFWTEFKDKNITPQGVVKLLDECKLTMPGYAFFFENGKNYWTYNLLSWYSILAGLELFDRIKAAELIEGMLMSTRRDEILIFINKYKANMKLNAASSFIKHSEFIKYMIQ